MGWTVNDGQADTFERLKAPEDEETRFALNVPLLRVWLRAEKTLDGESELASMRKETEMRPPLKSLFKA